MADWRCRGATAEGDRRQAHPAEEAAGRYDAKQRRFEGLARNKMGGAAAQREVVAYLQTTLSMSERWAGAAVVAERTKMR